MSYIYDFAIYMRFCRGLLPNVLWTVLHTVVILSMLWLSFRSFSSTTYNNR